MTSDQISLLNSIKGAAACILWALVFNGKPMDRSRLVAATGYTKNTVSKGLKILEDFDLVEYMGRYQGWYLTSCIHYFELPGLFGDESSGEDETAKDGFDDENEPAGLEPQFSPFHDVESDQKIKNSPFVPETAADKTKNSPIRPQDVERETKNSPLVSDGKDRAPKKSPQPPKNPVGETKKWALPDNSVNTVVEIHPPNLNNFNQVKKISTTATDLANGLDPRLLRAFRSAGLGLNPRTRALALLPHVTPRYVRAHHAQLKANGKAGRTGLLITILESGLPAPETYPNGHLKGCTCDECTRKYRYRLP